MACEMCAPPNRVHRAAAEVFDSSFARRPYGEGATVELTAEGELWVDTPLGDGHGNSYTILFPVVFCPWCGQRLRDKTEWEGWRG